MTGLIGKALVTGAGGFIGQVLCRQLLAAGVPLVTLSRSALPDTGRFAAGLEKPGFSGDIRDREVLDRAVAGVEVVYHLAGIAHVEGADRNLLQAVNVAGTASLAQAAAAAGVRRLVYFSSSLAAAAETNPENSTAYGRSKLDAERCLREVAQQAALEVIVLRPVNVYGPGMKGNLAALIRYIERGILPPLPRVKTCLSLIGVDDLCSAARLVGTHQQASGRTYVVSDGVDYPLKELEAAIYAALGRVVPAWALPKPAWWLGALAMEVRNRLLAGRRGPGLRTYHNLFSDGRYSNRALCEETGFRPQQDFYTALPGLLGLK